MPASSHIRYCLVVWFLISPCDAEIDESLENVVIPLETKMQGPVESGLVGQFGNAQARFAQNLEFAGMTTIRSVSSESLSAGLRRHRLHSRGLAINETGTAMARDPLFSRPMQEVDSNIGRGLLTFRRLSSPQRATRGCVVPRHWPTGPGPAGQRHAIATPVADPMPPKLSMPPVPCLASYLAPRDEPKCGLPRRATRGCRISGSGRRTQRASRSSWGNPVPPSQASHR